MRSLSVSVILPASASFATPTTNNQQPTNCLYSMEQQPPKEQDFDIIIVGAGPSAAGLLYGLLHRIISDKRCSSSNDDDISGKKSSSNNLSHLRIVILERGNSVNMTDNKLFCSKAADDTKMIPSSFEHCHPSTYYLQNWFQTAHYIPPLSSSSACKTTQHPTMLHTTSPQSHLSNRIIDVPTGTGWGGGTNINAGLVMQPHHHYFGNDDFENWPGRWRGGDLIQNSMGEILSVMKKNGGLLLTDSLHNDNFLQQSESGCPSSSFLADAKEDDSDEQDDVGFMSTFQRPTLSSTSSNRRVNYFTSLIAPLLKRHPELHSNVTFLSGVQVERILIRYSCDAKDDDDDDNVSTQKQQQQQQQCEPPQAWAVECNYGDHHGIIRSKRDIILCSGAIATPSLLLASGIGTEDDLRTAGITPWYDEQHVKCNIHNANNSHMEGVYRNLPVGHNLRDHIILPRVFLTPRPFNSGAAPSYNSINGWWMIHAPISSSSSTDAKMQLQLADGIQIDYMIPHFAAGALRRRWILPFGVHFLPLGWIQRIFLGVRAMLRVFFGIPVLSRWMKLRITFLNLCLLNPKSVGRVTVTSTSSSSSTIKSYARLSDCKVIIDPNYLSDSWDVESLWRGWTYSSRVKQRWFKRGIEILPGYTFSVGCVACSLISSAIHWMKALLGGSYMTKTNPNLVEMKYRNGSESMLLNSPTRIITGVEPVPWEEEERIRRGVPTHAMKDLWWMSICASVD